jgi:hypothetical protein
MHSLLTHEPYWSVVSINNTEMEKTTDKILQFSMGLRVTLDLIAQ